MLMLHFDRVDRFFFYLIAISNLALQQKTKTYLMEKKKISKQKVNEIPSRFGSTQRQTVE